MKRVLLCLIVVGLMSAAPVYAQGSARDAYGGGGGVLNQVGSGGAGNAPGSAPTSGGAGNAPGSAPTGRVEGLSSASERGRLPFTGFDLGLLALGGCVLLGVGVVVRRLSSPLS